MRGSLDADIHINERDYCNGLCHSDVFMAVPNISGQTVARSCILFFSVHRNGKRILCPYTLLCAGDMGNNDIFPKLNKLEKLSRINHWTDSAVLVFVGIYDI